MRPTPVALAFCLAMCAAPAASAADQVYKWTDADGVTHYGDAPPAEGEYERQRIQAPPPATDNAAVDTDEAATGEDPQCAEVRRHLALLRGDTPVQQDTDGDGKADRILGMEERETQARLAETMLDTYCDAPAAGA